MGRRSGWNKILCCARGLKTLALTRNVALEIVGGGGECLGCFPMENVYNPFLRLQHRWDLRPSSKGAAEVYDSGVSEQFPFQAVIGALPPSHLYLSTGFLRVTPPPRAAPRVSPRVEGS